MRTAVHCVTMLLQFGTGRLRSRGGACSAGQAVPSGRRRHSRLLLRVAVRLLARLRTAAYGGVLCALGLGCCLAGPAVALAEASGAGAAGGGAPPSLSLGSPFQPVQSVTFQQV